MSQHTNSMLFFAVMILWFFTVFANAKTVTIPGDASSIEEAVEMAESGDIIEVNQAEVPWSKIVPCKAYDRVVDIDCFHGSGIRIINKDLTILSSEGSSIQTVLYIDNYLVFSDDYDDHNTMLYIENSNVSFLNFTLLIPFNSRWLMGANVYPITSPIHVESGSMRIQDCNWLCLIECRGDLILENSTIQGSSWQSGNAYVGYNLKIPALVLGPSQAAKIEISDSTIECNTKDGYRAIVVNDLNSSEIIFSKSRVLGGHVDVIYGSSPSNFQGSDAIEIHDSHNTTFSFHDSQLMASRGLHATSYRHTTVYQAGEGGHAISFFNSSISIKCYGPNNLFKGGDGGNGTVTRYDPFGIVNNITIQDGKSGGHGFYLSNSHVDFSTQDILQQAVGGKKVWGRH